MEEATFLTRFAKSVTVVVRKDELRASRIMAQRAKDNPKISFAFNSAITAIHGDTKVTAVTLTDTRTGATREQDATGIFVAIGHLPRTELVTGQVELDDEGYIKVDSPTTLTNLSGVFACGDAVSEGRPVLDRGPRSPVNGAVSATISRKKPEKRGDLEELS